MAEVWDNKNSLELVGPWEHHDVVVSGFRVPFLTAQPMNGGMMRVTVDNRFTIDLNVAEAEHVLPWVADCIAVASGYTAHPRAGEIDEPIPRPPFTRMIGIFTEQAEVPGETSEDD